MGNKHSTVDATVIANDIRDVFTKVMHGKLTYDDLKHAVHAKVDEYKKWEVDGGNYYGRTVKIYYDDHKPKVDIMLRYSTYGCHDTEWLVVFCIIVHPNGKEAMFLHAPEENVYSEPKLHAHDPICRITNLYHPVHEDICVDGDVIIEGGENLCLDFLTFLCDQLDTDFVVKQRWCRRVIKIEESSTVDLSKLLKIPEKCFIKGRDGDEFTFPIVMDYCCVRKFYEKCFIFDKCDPAELAVKTKKFEIYLACVGGQLQVVYQTDNFEDLPKCFQQIAEACDFNCVMNPPNGNGHQEPEYIFGMTCTSTEYECVRQLFCCLRHDLFYKDCCAAGWYEDKITWVKEKPHYSKGWDDWHKKKKPVIWKDDKRPNFGKTFAANLTGDQEVPPVEVQASGFAKMVLNGDQTRLYYKVKVKDLSSKILFSHFHGAPAGENGPILKTLNPFFKKGEYCISIGCWSKDDPVEPLTGTDVAKLLGGDVYINVHTEEYPTGEVRGQVFTHPFKCTDLKKLCLKWIEFEKRYHHYGACSCMAIVKDENEEEDVAETTTEFWYEGWDKIWLKQCCYEKHYEKTWGPYIDCYKKNDYGKTGYPSSCHTTGSPSEYLKEDYGKKDCCKKDYGKKDHHKYVDDHEYNYHDEHDGCPKILIKSPCDQATVDCTFKLEVKIKDWDYQWGWFWDDCFVGKTDVCDNKVKFVVPPSKKGWHRVKVVLLKNYEKPEKYSKFFHEIYVNLKRDCGDCGDTYDHKEYDHKEYDHKEYDHKEYDSSDQKKSFISSKMCHSDRDDDYGAYGNSGYAKYD